MSAELKRTPLYALHQAQGARFTGFAGYEMPVQYQGGVLQEHQHTRAKAGLFDVSHMGQIALRPRSGDVAGAALALERLVPADLLGLKPGRQRYALLTNEAGGVLDDLMVANRGDHFLLVVNAACKQSDFSHLEAHLSDACVVEALNDRALLALQGTQADSVLARRAPEVAAMRFMDVRDLTITGVDCVVSRSGYTGEDGFEISAPADDVTALAETLLAEDVVAPIGLAARNTLRLEAGLCLYGADLDTETPPVEAGLDWAIGKARRRGGSRAGGFPGAEAILAQLETGAPRRRVGLRPEGRAPMRAGTPLYAGEADHTPIGRVTSGGFGPTLGAPIAMAYVSTTPEGSIFGDVRGKRLPAEIVDMPFVRPNYKRL